MANPKRRWSKARTGMKVTLEVDASGTGKLSGATLLNCPIKYVGSGYYKARKF